MHIFKQIFIGNILEAFYNSYKSLPANERDYWKEYDSLDNNRSLLYGGDNKIVITPKLINPDHLSNIKKVAGWKNVINLSPQNTSQSICKDITRSKDILSKLTQEITNNPHIEIIPYRRTKESFELFDYLRSENLKFTTPESGEFENNFIETYFHTKRGFRHLFEQAVDKNLPIKLPLGFMTENKDEATKAAYWFAYNKKNFVIKYNRGVQGIGLKFYNLNNLNGNLKDQLENDLREGIWNNTCIIVEEMINTDFSVFGGSPSVEMKIDSNGKVAKEYACGQILGSDNKTFSGVRINPIITNSLHINTAFKAASQIGKRLSQMGYVGYFDMDLVISKNNEIYAVESNLRRTGGTHIHEFAKSLLGKNYFRNYFISAYEIRLKNTKMIDYEFLMNKIKNISYNMENHEGVLFTNPDMIKVGIVPVMIVSKSLASEKSYTTELGKIFRLLDKLF